MVQAETDKNFEIPNESFKKEQTDKRDSPQRVQDAVARFGDGELLATIVGDLARAQKSHESNN